MQDHTVKDSVRRFVAFANYYREFIQNFAKISLLKIKRTDIDTLRFDRETS